MIISPGQHIINIADINAVKKPFGTIGGPVMNMEGETVLLTCYHCVFSPKLSWNDVIPAQAFSGLCVSDNGTAYSGKVATIEEVRRDDRIDAALIKGTDTNTIHTEIPELGNTMGKCLLSQADKGKVFVRKYGAATQSTFGIFDGFIPSFGALYFGENSFHFLGDLIKVRSSGDKPFATPGDSGSFVLNTNNQVAGIIVMTDGNTTYAIQSEIIESRLNITFI